MGGPVAACRDCVKLNAHGASNTPRLCAKHAPRTKCRDDLEMANGCLQMVHEALEDLGLDMGATPPMNYNDAIRQVAQILGRRAGLQTWAGIAGVVAEHEAAKRKPKGIQIGENTNRASRGIVGIRWGPCAAGRRVALPRLDGQADGEPLLALDLAAVRFRILGRRAD
jgi:hypothetical protein